MTAPPLPELPVRPRSYEFGPFRLNLIERRLLRGGEEIVLAAKAWEILLMLVNSGGRTISKEEFMREVWRDAIVEDANLADNISTLRQLLGDDARDPKFIRTVPKVGYRFVAPVAVVEPELVIHERSRTRLVIEEQPSARISTVRRKSLFAALGVAVLAVGVAVAAWIAPREPKTRRGAVPAPEKAPVVSPLTTYPQQEFSPALSPDGKLVAFIWSGGFPDAIHLYVRQVDIGEPVKLTSATARDGNPAWSPDGRHIAFTRGSARSEECGIFLIPALGGTERRLLQVTELGKVSWSPDGKTLAYAHKQSVDAAFQISLVDVETLETRPLTKPPADVFGDYWLSFSPDGSAVAFVRIVEDLKAADLYVTGVRGGEPRRVTFNDRYMSGVAWDPRGDRLIFSSKRGDREILWKVASSGGTPLPLDPTVEDALDPSVSGDGTSLAFTRLTSDSNIYRLDLDAPGASAVPLIASTRQDRNPRMSPDGRRIAFESDRSGEDEIWLANADGSAPSQLTRSDRFGAGSPAWSHDGRQIAFVSSAPSSDVYVIGAPGGRARRLTSGFNAAAPSWSRDGRFVYFSVNREGRWQVWRIPEAGGEATQVTRDGGYESAESMDGRFLFYTKYGYNGQGLFRLSLRGDDAERVYPFRQLASLGDWALTPRGFYFIHRYDGEGTEVHRASHPSIRFFDFASGRVTEVASLPDPGPDPGLSLVDGETAAVFSRGSRSSDLMLIRNYR